MSKKRNKIVLWIIIILFVALISAYFSRQIFNRNLFKINYEKFNTCKGDYNFINPEVACLFSSSEDYLERNKRLESKIQEMVDYLMNNGKATNISVFVRDLVARRWIGINENTNFAPASLLKLPILIAYYKLSEIEPTVLSKKHTYNGPTEINDEMQRIKPKETLEVGKEYTVEELLFRMIVYSDNNALSILYDSIDNDFLNDVFIDLGIYVPVSSSIETKLLSPKAYGNILRMLFNSSYLEPLNSDKALDLLTKTTFNDGLRSNIPQEIKIAHKFGERETKAKNNNIVTENLYDCGIVYYTENPYILCIMTQGFNLNDLGEVIRNISRVVYEEFSD
jgi:beta-lactamase class A